LAAKNKNLVKSNLELRDRFSTRATILQFRNDCSRFVFKSLLFELCLEFIKICYRLDNAPNNTGDISIIVAEAFSVDIDSILDASTNRIRETMYYISGWTLNAMNRIAQRRKGVLHDLI